MKPVAQHSRIPDASFDGGTLDCGSGLLLLIRKNIDPLLPGQLLEIRSQERSVAEDLPAWCRLTGNELLSWIDSPAGLSFLVAKGGSRSDSVTSAAIPSPVVSSSAPNPSPMAAEPRPAAPSIPPCAVMGIGSWPRPPWLLRMLHERLEGRIPVEEFERAADDAVRLAVGAQLRSGGDVVTDGEQRRDNYASFVGTRLENCQLIPLTDLLPLVDDPEKFRKELEALDVPAADIRHPALFGRLRRAAPLAVHELDFLRTLTDKPAKVALPGPYLLTRTMWLECVSDRAYETREELAHDVVTVLREEIQELLDHGASLVQLDEPVLSEVVFGAARGGRCFMCGALGERRESTQELGFAAELLRAVTQGLPTERLAMHVCRGNWTTDESVALHGPYDALMPLFCSLPVGTLFLEAATARAGSLEVLRALPDHLRIGVGVVDQKHETPPVSEIQARMAQAVHLFGRERLLFTPDCGFATFADSPIAAQTRAEQHLRTIVQARNTLPASDLV